MMSMNELVKWLESRGHQVTVCFRIETVETLCLYIKMIDMKTGMVNTCLINYQDDRSLLDIFKFTLDKMYQELMDALGREEKKSNAFYSDV